MTRDEATREACAIVALAYKSIGNLTHPSDGFCSKCETHCGPTWNYQNAGKALAYVRRAVVKQLKRDGHKIADGFKRNGKEKI